MKVACKLRRINISLICVCTLVFISFFCNVTFDYNYTFDLYTIDILKVISEAKLDNFRSLEGFDSTKIQEQLEGCKGRA